MSGLFLQGTTEDDEIEETSERPSDLLFVARKNRHFIVKDYINFYEKPFQSLGKYNEG